MKSKKPKINVFNAIVILIAAALMFAAVILLGSSPLGFIFPSAGAQTLPAPLPRVTLPTQMEGMDRMTYVMPLTDGHPFCWSDGNAEQPRVIRIYRYRVEGGPKALYLELPRTLWQVKTPAGNFCSSGTHKVPKAGHWVYEAEICWLPVAADGSNCSPRVSAACPASSGTLCAGAVASAARGWWVYAYLPAPTGPVVN